MDTHYIALLEDEGPNVAVGVWFPDLPGCFSAGDSFEDAMRNASEAAELWLEALDGKPWPKARSLSELKADPQFIEDLKDFNDSVIYFAAPVRLMTQKAA